jgi:uncharacterized protein
MTVLVLITIFAAFVNGGLGYGFSSITVPVALLYHTNRILNPALVLIEVGANLYVVISNRSRLRKVWRRVASIIVGLIPTVVIGSLLLKSIDSSSVKLVTYCFMAPLILLQSYGFRKPLHTEKTVGVIFGGLVGLLYSLTTISGPPLAIMLNNEGFEKEDFKAAIGLIRIVESTFTALMYFYLGFFTPESMSLFMAIAPGVLIAMPVGSYLLSKLDPTTFRRICISVDVWLISFGLFRVLLTARFPEFLAFAICLSTVILDAVNLIRYFVLRRAPVAPVISIAREKSSERDVA